MMETIRAATYKDSEKSFLEALDKHQIQYRRLMPRAGVVMASGLAIEIIISGGWGALAVACIAWAHARKSRRINVITKDGRSVWLEGYSAEEAEKTLQSADEFSAIDTEKSDD